jgi:hypothetical protein
MNDNIIMRKSVLIVIYQIYDWGGLRFVTSCTYRAHKWWDGYGGQLGIVLLRFPRRRRPRWQRWAPAAGPIITSQHAVVSSSSSPACHAIIPVRPTTLPWATLSTTAVAGAAAGVFRPPAGIAIKIIHIRWPTRIMERLLGRPGASAGGGVYVRSTHEL